MILIRVCRLLSARKYQRARAAAKVIRFVSAQPFLAGTSWDLPPGRIKSIDQNPFSRQIIEKLKEDKQLTADTVKFYQMMLDPREGVQLPAPYCTQKRIKDGSQNISSYIAPEKDQLTTNSNSNRFVFFPNRIITPLIFNILKRFNDKTLLYGQPGIAKSSSIIFYCYLAHLITEYNFSEEAKVQQEQFLDIPRLIYLSYLPNSVMEDILLNLNSQMPAALASASITQFKSKLKLSFYEKRLAGRVVLDQFNSIVALARSYNTELQRQKDSAKLKTLKQKTQQQIDLWVNTAQSLFPEVVVYNSSSNIETELLDKATDYDKRITFNLNHHSKIQKVVVSTVFDYRDKNMFLICDQPQKQALVDRELVHNIFFEIKRRNSIPQSAIVLQQALKLCLERMQNKQLFRLTPLDIRICFQKFGPISDQASAQTIATLVQKQLSAFRSAVLSRKQQQTQKYHGNLNSFAALFIIVQYRLFLKERRPKSPEQYWMQIDEKQHSFKVQALDKNLFLVRTEVGVSKVWIRTALPIQLFLEVTEVLNQNLVKSLLAGEFVDKLVQLVHGNNGLIGSMVQAMILQYLRHSLYFEFPFSFQIPIINCRKTFEFVHFNNTKLTFAQRFKTLLDKKGMYVGYPITQTKLASHNSKSIDLLLASKLKEGGYIFYSIDFKVLTQVSKDIEQSAINVMKFCSLEEVKQWTHYIVSMRGTTEVKKIEQGRYLRYVSLEELVQAVKGTERYSLRRLIGSLRK